MKITKLQAGIIQIKEAINLFFEGRNVVAIHTIAGAGSGLLFDLSEHEGIESFVRGNPNVRSDKKRLWISKLNEAQNFLKHADRDKDGILDFNQNITGILLFEGCLLIESLTQEIIPEVKVFLIWFATKNPDVLAEGALKNAINSAIANGIDIEDFETMRHLTNHSSIS